MNELDIGSRLRALREQNQLTQEDVGKRIGVTKATINRYETGEIDIKRTVAIKLARVLSTTPQYIMGWDNNITTENKPGEPELEENMIVYHRDGKTSEIKLTPKKMDLIVQMINEFKDKDTNPDL